MIGYGYGIGLSPNIASLGVAFDADAQSFFTAAGITDNTEKSAVNTLVTSLKTNSLWTKFNALYPMVGSSSSSMKYNLVNPVDSDAAFRLGFAGGWSFGSAGATPNGTTAYAFIYMSPATTLSANNLHISFYSRTNTANAGQMIGCSDGNPSELPIIALNVRTGGGAAAAYLQDYSAGTFVSVANANSQGFYIMSRTASNSMKLYKTGSQIGSTASTSTAQTLPTRNLVLSAYNYYAGVTGYDDRQCALASIGSGLSDAEASTFNTIVTNYQTTLGRNV